MSRFSFLALGVLALAGVSGLTAAEPPSVEAQLRESLRATILQLRSVEGERATLQAAQADSAQQLKLLNEQIAVLTRHGIEDKAAADKAAAGLKSQLADLSTELARTKESLAQTRQTEGQTAEALRTEQARRAKVEADNLALQRLVADREAKNLELFKTASEILSRYEHFSLGEALRAREPFVGLTRVKLETLVQDYQDKLADERVKQP